MSAHPDETTLNDFVDGVLASPAQDETATHIAGCLECRRRADSLGGLRTALAALSRDIVPPTDVLAAVHADIEDNTPPAVRTGLRRLRIPLLAAAAVALVAATATVTALLLRPEAPAVVTNAAPTGSVRLVSAHPLERSWQDAIAELQRQLDASPSALAPETRQVIESSLEVIDRALAEARAALLADPSNAALADVLRSGYERKLDVLRSAAEHARPAS